MTTLFTNGVVILPDRFAFRTTVVVDGEHIRFRLIAVERTVRGRVFVVEEAG